MKGEFTLFLSICLSSASSALVNSLRQTRCRVQTIYRGRFRRALREPPAAAADRSLSFWQAKGPEQRYSAKGRAIRKQELAAPDGAVEPVPGAVPGDPKTFPSSSFSAIQEAT